MDYFVLSLIGGLVFLGTSFLDYYWTQKSSNNTNINEASHPSEIPVGSSPETTSYLTKTSLEPRLLGYIGAILLQIPFTLSMIGVL